MDLKNILALYKTEVYKYYKPTTPENVIIQTWLIFDSHEDYFSKYLGFYRNLPDFTQLIIHAVDGTFELTNNGIKHFIKHNHQKTYTQNGVTKGINQEVLRNVRNNLLKEIDKLEIANTFEQLFNIISNAKERGFGPLAIYDTSVRIGTYLGLEPSKVFLHAGAQAGMKLLEQKGYVQLGLSEELFVDIHYLPLELQELKPLVTEHFLCSQKDQLKLLPEIKFLEKK